MNKSELVKTVAGQANLTQTQAKAAVDAVFASMTETLKAGEQVVLPGIMTISVGKRAQRTGKNPLTGQTVVYPEKNIVKFKAGSLLKNAVQ